MFGPGHLGVSVVEAKAGVGLSGRHHLRSRWRLCGQSAMMRAVA